MSNSSYYETPNGQLHIDSDCHYIMLVLTDAKNNNNKFYELTYDNGTIKSRYGRVGSSGVTAVQSGTISQMFSKAREKFKKGYKPVEIIEQVDGIKKQEDIDLLKIAINQLVYKPTRKTKTYAEEQVTSVQNLIKHLVHSNRHKIMETSGNKIQVDDSGLVKTELGILSLNAIHKAKQVLAQIEQIFSKNVNIDKDVEFIELINQYLTLIPQKVSHSRGWHLNFFSGKNKFLQQYDFLQQLEDSVSMYNQIVENSKQQLNNSNDEQEIVYFTKKLKVVTDNKVIQKIGDFFDKHKNDKHSSSTLKLKNVYEIILLDEKGKPIPNTSQQFETKVKEIGNVNMYWHGTRKFNILSILKNGLMIPKSDNFNVTGRMFGDGVYFAKQSTKSLNYSQGYWDGGARDNTCFMFLADVAMGKPFKAGHQEYQDLVQKKTKIYPVEGYDSTIATGHRKNLIHSGSISSLSNDEMIVYNLDQINLRYLCEFSE